MTYSLNHLIIEQSGCDLMTFIRRAETQSRDITATRASLVDTSAAANRFNSYFPPPARADTAYLTESLLHTAKVD